MSAYRVDSILCILGGKLTTLMLARVSYVTLWRLKMRFKNLTVYVDYRMKAGKRLPTWKALRARVKNGSILGEDLTRQGITDPDQCIIEVINRLVNDGVLCDTLTFEFSDLLLEKGCVNCSYQMADGIVKFGKTA